MKIKITGLPKFRTAGSVNGCQWDEYWDGTKCVKFRPYEQIFDVETTVGGYNPASDEVLGLPNAGYNYRRGFYVEDDKNSPNYGKMIDARTGQPAVNYQDPGVKDYESFYNLFKQEYEPDLMQFDPQLRTEAGDLLYNAGVDPRIYLLDQYIKQVEGVPAGLQNRGSFRQANKAGVWADADKQTQFNTIYDQYASKIAGLPAERQRELLNAGREFYYRNTNRGDIVNGRFVPSATGQGSVENPAVKSWLQRYGMPSYAGRFKQQPPAAAPTSTTPPSGYGTTSVTTNPPAPTISTPPVLPPNPPVVSSTPVVSPSIPAMGPTGFSPLSVPSFPNLLRSSGSTGCGPGERKNPITGECEPIPTFGVPSSPQIRTNLNRPGFIRNPITGTYGMPPKPSFSSPFKSTTTTETRGINGPAVAATMVSGLSFLGNTLQGIQEEQDLAKFNRKYGQTDAGNPVVKNVYSRGRNVMNTPAGADYAPNQMTPVQFAGRPVSEFTGYPAFPYNVYAQDGLSVTEDILNLPTLYSEMPGLPVMPDLAPAAPPAQTSGGGSPTIMGDYAFPLEKIHITSGFGRRAAPLKGASTDHNGLDLRARENTAVFSPMDGVVEKIYNNWKGGNQLIIRHADGSKTGYAHLNSYNVKVGDAVKMGQQIALSGNTGNSKAAHLHFTYRNPQGKIVDPSTVFNFKGAANASLQKGITNWDHHNPGNIHIGNFAKGYGATQGRADGNGHVAIFPDMETGLRAMTDLLFGSKYSNLTVSQARNKWVKGDPNQPSESTPHIVAAIGQDKTMADLTPEERQILIKEYIKWEDRQVYKKLFSSDLESSSKKSSKKQYGGLVNSSQNTFFEMGGTFPNNNNNMKIKITGTPGKHMYADGGRTVGDQMGYGLYRGQSVRDFNAFNKQDEDNYDENVRSTESGVPRQYANIEAEEGEKIIAADGMSIKDIKGKKHSKGGTPMDADPGSYIVSDFITAPKTMQAAMGFEVKSNKKKDNTWARVLDSKVKSKDFNRLSQIIQAAAEGREVDPYELSTAKNKLPVYNDYVSKAALGNELTKMMMGKPFEIPQIALPAMMSMFPEMTQEMISQNSQSMPDPNAVVPMARFGGSLPTFAEAGSVNDDIKPWRGDRFGRYKRTGPRSNASRYSKEQWKDKLRALGYNGPWNNLAVQRFLYSIPEAKAIIDKYHGTGPEGYGQPIRGMFDETLGVRWDEALDAVPTTTTTKPPDTTLTTTKPPGTTLTTTKPPETTITTTKPTDFTYDEDGDREFGKTPYVQDIVNLSAATANQYAYPNIGPYMGRYNPVYIDPAFVSTEAIDRMIQSQGRTAMEDASLYGSSPQTQAARQSQISQQVLPSMIQNRVQTNQQNVATDMGARQFNAQVANQAALMDAQVTSQLAESNARLAQNRAKERVMGRTASKNMLNKMITNAGDTYLMNQWFPQYAFNPLDYEVYFKRNRGKGLLDDATSSGSFTTALQQATSYAEQLGLTGKDKNDAIMDYMEYAYPTSAGRRGSMMNPYYNRRGVSPSFDDGTTAANPMMFDYGGFIPMYYVGGWY